MNAPLSFQDWLKDEQRSEEEIRASYPNEVRAIEEGLSLCYALLQSMCAAPFPDLPEIAKGVMIARLLDDLAAAWLLLRRGVYFQQLVALLRHSDEGLLQLALFVAEPSAGESWLREFKRYQMKELRQRLSSHPAVLHLIDRYSSFSRISHPNADYYYMRANEAQQRHGSINPTVLIKHPDEELFHPWLLVLLLNLHTVMRLGKTAKDAWLPETEEWDYRWNTWQETAETTLMEGAEAYEENIEEL
jgi:hypothetical protein